MRRSLELRPGQRQWLENLLKVEEQMGNEPAVKALRERLSKPQEPVEAR
jgi:hypothetical protein